MMLCQARQQSLTQAIRTLFASRFDSNVMVQPDCCTHLDVLAVDHSLTGTHDCVVVIPLAHTLCVCSGD